MGKTTTTKHLEKILWRYTQKMGTFGCFEVSIGFGDEYRNGVERVDYITYNTKGEFRCYEIKTSMSDFKSKAKKTFLGHYNYFVMTPELYKEINEKDKWLISPGIGVITISNDSNSAFCVSKPSKKQVSYGMSGTLLESMVRSLHRETSKYYETAGYWQTTGG